jgi:membrane-bound serine protease (ClpP class)
MDLLFIILLILFGIGLLVVEILIVPGGVLGVVSILMIAYGVYSVYDGYGTTAGHIAFASSVVVCGGLVIYSLKSGAWKRLAQKGVIEGKMNTISELLKPGEKGIAVSALRPMGNALFGDEKVEVSTEGENIPAQTPVEIIKIEYNKIYVRKTEN